MSTPDIIYGDAEVRTALRSLLWKKHSSDGNTVFLEELGLCRGQVRVDLAVVNGSLHGFEIKSDRDCLRRLAGQVSLYSKVLDRATLVVGDRHLTEALGIVPEWWGILRIEPKLKRLSFKTFRRGRKNPRRDARHLVELLWLEEAIALLARHDAVRGVRGKPRRIVWDKVCQHFTVDEIAERVRAQLKTRATLQAPVQPW